MPVWMRRAAFGIVVLGIVAVLAWAFRPVPIPVDVAPVRRGPIAVTVDEDGRTRIRERYTVSSPLTGRLRRITLDPGDPVREGETIVAIIEPTDPRLLDARELAEAEARVRAAEAAVRRSQAESERARAAYDFAEDELADLREAFAKGGAGPREVEEQESLHRMAMEDHRSAMFGGEIATFELEQARSALLHTTGGDGPPEAQFPIRAPISGKVLRVLQESVAVVQPGTPLLELGNPADLEIVIDVLSTDAVRIREGARIVIDHWGGDTPLEATVRLVEPSAFTKVSALGVDEQRVNVIADFVTPFAERATLADGYRIEARIVLWEAADELLVPSSALFRSDAPPPAAGGAGNVANAADEDAARDDGWAVYVVERGRAVLRQIVIGRRTGLVAQVREGLGPGDVVIVHPSDKITSGARVQRRSGA